MGYAALFFAVLFVLLSGIVIATLPGPQRSNLDYLPVVVAFAAFLALAAASILSAMTLVD